MLSSCINPASAPPALALTAYTTHDDGKVDNSKKETDALLAREMNQLSMAEREKIYHDIHGVAEIVDEDPEFILQCLTRLEQELSKIPNSRKEAYNKASSLSPDHVDDRKFRLKFLRAFDYDPNECAEKIVSFFQWKLRLWGADKLGRDIRLSDFDGHDLECLKNGHLQLLPARDRAGRAMLCLVIPYENWHVIENQVCTCMVLWLFYCPPYRQTHYFYIRI
jgi:hypothetical protein